MDGNMDEWNGANCIMYNVYNVKWSVISELYRRLK